MTVTHPEPERSEPSPLVITGASPISDALDAILVARDVVWAVRAELLSASTADLLLHELDCAAEELVDGHERSSRVTEWLFRQLASAR